MEGALTTIGATFDLKHSPAYSIPQYLYPIVEQAAKHFSGVLFDTVKDAAKARFETLSTIQSVKLQVPICITVKNDGIH